MTGKLAYLSVIAAASVGLTMGCGGPKSAVPTVESDASTDGGAVDDVVAAVELLGAPLIFAPTSHGFGMNVVLRSGDPSALRARVRPQGAQSAAAAWTDVGLPSSPALDIAQWSVDGLAPGVRYDYEVYEILATQTLYRGSAVTTRGPGSAFSFAVLADPHIEPRDPIPAGTTPGSDEWGFDESTLLAVSNDIQRGAPDFLVNLGDMLDYHIFGFNQPPPDSAWSRLGYLDYRRMLGDTLGQAAHFPVIGNWDGESGCNTQEQIQRSLGQRLLYAPGPRPDTYAQGGSPNQDYYAFTWGDALFVVLNVMTYTPTCHLLDYNPGVPDDWTLGDTQLAWLDQTLARATSRWRFLFIHHAVGGAAGNDIDSAYGRGGGQAAHVGEQGTIHEMMIRYGVQIFFYAHDHVFTDMLVDGIHYTLPGSAGAPWKFTPAETGYTQYWPDSGFGRVAVGPDRVQVEFVAVGGQVLTSYSIE